MFRLSTRVLTVPAVAAVVIAVLAANPGDLGPGAVPPDDDPAAAAADDRMAARREAVAARIAHKEALVHGLVDGQFTLAAVAAEFQRVNGDAPECLGAVRTHFPAATAEESCALNVIEYVRLRACPADIKERVLADLRCEFAGRYGRPPGC